MKILAALALASCAAAALFAAGPSSASCGPVGDWRVTDGSEMGTICPCGHAPCGFVASATRHQSTTVGRQVFYAAAWRRMVRHDRNNVDGQRYAGHISLAGERTLKLEGCVSGGMICGGQQWARLR